MSHLQRPSCSVQSDEPDEHYVPNLRQLDPGPRASPKKQRSEPLSPAAQEVEKELNDYGIESVSGFVLGTVIQRAQMAEQPLEKSLTNPRKNGCSQYQYETSLDGLATEAIRKKLRRCSVGVQVYEPISPTTGVASTPSGAVDLTDVRAFLMQVRNIVYQELWDSHV